MSNLLAWLLIGLLLLAGGVGGCQQAADGPPQTTVRLMVHGDPPEQAAFIAVAQAFEAQNPDVRVDLLGLPSAGDFYARLAADFAAGAPPDVFLLNYRRLAQFHNRGALQPLGARLDASTQIDAGDLFPIALDAFRDGSGTPVCLPQNISSQVVFYNKDMFDAAGLPYPQDDWTWQTLRATAQQLTLPDANGDGEPDQYGLGLEPTILRVASFIWQNGGEMVDDPAAPTRLTLTSPEALDALAFIVNLSARDGVVPNRTAEAVRSHGDRFLLGNIAMYVNSRRIVPTLRESADFNWDVAALPTGQRAASVLHSDGYCMAAASQVQDAAWRLIEFAISPAGQVIAAELGRTVPSLQTVANSAAFLDPMQPPANAQVWLDAVPSLRLLPRLQNWPEIERTAAIELELAYLSVQPAAIAAGKIEAVAADGFIPLR